ncbi:MAG: pantetheine-phosphate adenylyltransferase [Lachnospiraceae bacterium]|nr:pantetheine-phosphate adenylyltransferase [Lachnospiraceae bacterium]
MSKAIYPGSFDPVTLGHVDIIHRAAKMFDSLTVSVLNNSEKTPLFSVDERVKMLREVCKDLSNVKIDSFSGLTADYAQRSGTDVIIRGLRAITDFEYELQMAQTNRKILPTLDTVFLTTSLEYAYLSSSIVREVASYGGDIHEFVTPDIAEKVYSKLGVNRDGK